MKQINKNQLPSNIRLTFFKIQKKQLYTSKKCYKLKKL